MLILSKVAVTGGLACGKSSVCRIFKELGAYVVSADEIVHQLLSPDTPVGQKVIDLLGADVVNNRQIDRSKIAKKVFNQPALLQALENILHPSVREEVERQYQLIKTHSSFPLFVAEIPLLFESSHLGQFHYTIAVIADAEVCQQRFINSTGYDAEEFIKRMNRQLPNDEKAKRADFVIVNDGSVEALKDQVKEIYFKITNP